MEVLLKTVRSLPDWCGWHEGTSDASDSRGRGGGRVVTCHGSVNHLVGWYTQQQIRKYMQFASVVHTDQNVLSPKAPSEAAQGKAYCQLLEGNVHNQALYGRCTWLPSRWPRHPWIPQHAWIPAPGALLPDGTMDLSTGWRSCSRPV